MSRGRSRGRFLTFQYFVCLCSWSLRWTEFQDPSPTSGPSLRGGAADLPAGLKVPKVPSHGRNLPRSTCSVNQPCDFPPGCRRHYSMRPGKKWMSKGRSWQGNDGQGNISLNPRKDHPYFCTIIGCPHAFSSIRRDGCSGYADSPCATAGRVAPWSAAGVNGKSGFLARSRPQEILAIDVIQEDRLAPVTPAQDVLNRPSILDSHLARHG